MLSDQLDCKDSEDPLRLRDFVKNYSASNSSSQSLFRSLNNLIIEEASFQLKNLVEDVEMQEGEEELK